MFLLSKFRMKVLKSVLLIIASHHCFLGLLVYIVTGLLFFSTFTHLHRERSPTEQGGGSEFLSPSSTSNWWPGVVYFFFFFFFEVVNWLANPPSPHAPSNPKQRTRKTNKARTAQTKRMNKNGNCTWILTDFINDKFYKLFRCISFAPTTVNNMGTIHHSPHLISESFTIFFSFLFLFSSFLFFFFSLLFFSFLFFFFFFSFIFFSFLFFSSFLVSSLLFLFLFFPFLLFSFSFLYFSSLFFSLLFCFHTSNVKTSSHKQYLLRRLLDET